MGRHYKYDKSMSKLVHGYLHGEQKKYFEEQKKRLRKDTDTDTLRAIIDEHKRFIR